LRASDSTWPFFMPLFTNVLEGTFSELPLMGVRDSPAYRRAEDRAMLLLEINLSPSPRNLLLAAAVDVVVLIS
jgi:hypothetical protein